MKEASNVQMVPIEMYYKEYDDILIGAKDSASSVMMSKQQRSKITDDIIRYAFEYYLEWTPEDAAANINLSVIKEMRLTSFLKRIPCPGELDERKDIIYVTNHLYPQTNKFTQGDLVVLVYKEVLHGKRDKFPKLFFDGFDGQNRARICLLTLVREYLTTDFSDIGEMYAYFADETKSRPKLLEYRLRVPLRDIYKSPIDYLHDALPENLKSEYHYMKHTDPEFDKYDWPEFWNSKECEEEYEEYAADAR
jgi:hypothetical protein